MINLYTSYYIDPSPARQAELDECLHQNILNNHINKIFLLLEYPIVNEQFNSGKINIIYIKGRPEYNTFFEIINENTSQDDWNIIANSDIFFDHTIDHLNKYDHSNVIVLCRWDVFPNGLIKFLNSRDSQDSWIVKGKIENVNGNFYLGKAGCDNAIADRFNRAGYKVINPSKTIKTYHLHNSGVRSYNPNDRVPQPYYLIPPHE